MTTQTTDIDICEIHPDYLTVGHIEKNRRNADLFAQADGFDNYPQMVNWFLAKYEAGFFVGKVIKWRLI